MKTFGIAFPSETYDTYEEALKAAAEMLNESEIASGVYIYEAKRPVHVNGKRVIETAEVKS